jgi:hypothetical protein
VLKTKGALSEFSTFPKDHPAYSTPVKNYLGAIEDEFPPRAAMMLSSIESYAALAAKLYTMKFVSGYTAKGKPLEQKSATRGMQKGHEELYERMVEVLTEKASIVTTEGRLGHVQGGFEMVLREMTGTVLNPSTGLKSSLAHDGNNTRYFGQICA